MAFFIPASLLRGFVFGTLMSASQPAYFHLQEFSDMGTLLAGGRLYTYAQGTTAFKAAYTDAEGVVPQTYTADGLGGQYIALNARGELPTALYLASGAYDIALKRPDGSTVWSRPALPTADGLLATLASFLSSIGASLIGFIQSGAGAVLMTVQEALREHPSIARFGSKPSNSDNRAAIQKAINAGFSDLYVNAGVHDVTLDKTSAALAGVFGIGSVALHPRSNLRLYGPGTIRLKTGENGTSGAIFGNWDGAPISNFILDGIGLDGNRANTTGQVSGAVLVDATECGFQWVKAKHISYCGLQMRRSSGYDGASNFGVKDCWVTNCTVNDIAYIAVQVNRPDGVRIESNSITTVTDNAIDVEGNDPAGGQANAGFGRKIQVMNNAIDDVGGGGVFIESVGDVMAIGNRIADAATGMYFNRVNSGSLGNLVTANKLSRAKFPGGYGMLISNNSGDMSIFGNSFDGFTNGIWLANTGVYVSVGRNDHKNVGQYCVAWPKIVNAAIKCQIDRQVMKDLPGNLYATPQTYPALSPPTNCPSNIPGRTFRVSVTDGWSLEAGAVLYAGFKVGTAVLVYSTGWAAYSLYNFGSDGKTRLYLSGFVASAVYVVINGIAYKLTAVGDGSTYVSQWNGTIYADGNFTTVLNSALSAEMYSAAWATE